jgi:membrane-associated phospholipid phosphatase
MLRAAGRWMEEPRFLNRAAWYVWKLAIAVAIAGLVSIFYFNASKLTAHRQNDLSISLDHAIPFLRWTFWVYFPGYLAGILFCVAAFRNTTTFYKTCLAIVIGQTLCTIGFFILPSTFPRPLDAGGGLTGEALRWFWVLDPPNNTFPSKHVCIMTLCSFGLWLDDNNRLKWIGSLFWLGVLITVHTCKQHYLVDAVAGVGVALFSYWLVFRWWPKRKATRGAEPTKDRFKDTARA